MNNESTTHHSGQPLEYISKVIETCLLTATSPITSSQLSNVFDNKITQSEIERLLFEIGQKYSVTGIELICVASGYRFRSRLEFQPYLNKLHTIRPPKYSRSIMETLAIIAYKQPVTRGDIEEIRGVTVNSTIIQTLNERGWIEVIGYKQVPGRPELLATTTKLLEDLGIASLEELPPLLTEAPEKVSDNDLIEEYDALKEQSNG